MSAKPHICPSCGHHHKRKGNQVLRVIKLLARDKGIKEIAAAMKISVHTVQYHWHAAKVAYRFKSYVSAARWAYKKGLVKL